MSGADDEGAPAQGRAGGGSVLVRWEAVDPSGMTLDELAAFVQQAMRMEVPGDTVLRVRIGWSAQVKIIATGRIR